MIKEKRKMIGTTVYYYNNNIITQAAVYEGEKSGDWKVYRRAYEGLAMLNRDKLLYLSHAIPVFYPIGS